MRLYRWRARIRAFVARVNPAVVGDFLVYQGSDSLLLSDVYPHLAGHAAHNSVSARLVLLPLSRSRTCLIALLNPLPEYPFVVCTAEEFVACFDNLGGCELRIDTGAGSLGDERREEWQIGERCVYGSDCE